MDIEAFGAGHGDALLVRWDCADGVMHQGLVDGGPASRYNDELRPNIESLAVNQGGSSPSFDFVCVSHIDDDHIGGIERVFTHIRRQMKDGVEPLAKVRRLWFNSWEQLGLSPDPVELNTTHPAVAASVRQGRDLRDVARFLHLDGNAPAGEAFLAGVGFDLDGLRVDVVAPGPVELDKLLATWQRTEKKPPAFAAAYDDRSIPNLSSIALLLRSGGRTALLTGDASGDHVIRGLEAGQFLIDGHLHVDVLKLPHHGSINNVAPGFFTTISADRYIVSADGVTHGLPNTDCLDLLLQSRASTDEFELVFTNPMPVVQDYIESKRGTRPIAVRARADGARGVVA
jgi:hypothetical protein